MHRFLQAMIWNLPGSRRLNRCLERHYTGCEHPEFVLRGSFHSPLPDLKEVRANGAALFSKDVDTGPSIRLRSEEQTTFLRELSRYYADFKWPEQLAPGYRYYLNNPYFCHGDALSLYSILRHFRPRRIIEAGSGFSSALMLDTDDRFLGGNTRFQFIEPYPARLRSLLGTEDTDRVRVVEERVQKMPVALFSELQANDILFIDSSHVAKLGSDVNYLIFQVLPRLQPGVLVHVHDIMWPFEYPREWVIEGRAWNEVYLLRAFLQYNEAFDILLFNSYLGHQHRALLTELMPKFLANTGGSLWLLKTGA
jgi:Methyltransferase domain